MARASPRCKTRGLKGAAAHGGRYMRLGYAHMDNLPFAAIKNRAGSYVTPDPNPAASLAVALPSSIASPRWDRVNLAVNGAGGGGGPAPAAPGGGAGAPGGAAGGPPPPPPPGPGEKQLSTTWHCGACCGARAKRGPRIDRRGATLRTAQRI